MFYYPEIKTSDVEALRNIRIIIENLLQHPDYLDNTACTYSPEVKLLLKSFIPENTQPVAQEIEKTANPDEFDLLSTSLEVINELQLMKGSLKSMATNEKISTYRLLVSQLEKVTELMRQSQEIDHYKQFKTTLFNTLERHLSPAQISEFIEDFQDEVKDKNKI